MRNRGTLVVALLLIFLGVWYLMVELYPPVKAFSYSPQTWPWQIIGFGALFFVLAILAWVPALFIPGSVIAGVGIILYYQNLTGQWDTWSYAWTLIPGFGGFGLLLFGLLSRRRGALVSGVWNLFSSLILFGIFGSALGSLKVAGIIWPLGLILLGVYFIVRFLLRKPSRDR